MLIDNRIEFVVKEENKFFKLDQLVRIIALQSIWESSALKQSGENLEKSRILNFVIFVLFFMKFKLKMQNCEK